MSWICSGEPCHLVSACISTPTQPTARATFHPTNSDALLDQIFKPLFTTEGFGQGTGLGLSIVRGVVRPRGGTIRVRNRAEGGTVFEIMLPSFDASVDTAGDRRPGAPERRRRWGGG